jgi:hypothetical protein
MAEQELVKFQVFSQEKKFEMNIMGGFAGLPGPYDQI